MYEIEFYEKPNGECDVWDFLESLRMKIGREHKRHLSVKLKEPKSKEMITKQGRRLKRNENMGRL